MNSTLAISTTFLPPHKSNPKTLQKPTSKISFSSKFSCNYTINPQNNEHPFAKTLKFGAKTAILTFAATLIAAKFNQMPVKAETLAQTVQESTRSDENLDEINGNVNGSVVKSPLTQLIESNPEFVDNLRVLLEKKLEIGENDEALKLLRKLVESQPDEMEWRFELAKLLIELGKNQESREVFEGILALQPLSFEALLGNALVMDRCGERDTAISRLESALTIAVDENKGNEARDVKLIIAQVHFLQKNVDEALNVYDELIKENPKDFRPYFAKGMVYSLLGRNSEAKLEFVKYKELAPKNAELRAI